MKEKYGLPVLLLIVFALTRVPGAMPWNFSATIALLFCAGAYLPRDRAWSWWLPLGTVFATDAVLDLFIYDAGIVSIYTLFSYAAYAGIIVLGRRFHRTSSWMGLLGGGLLGAILFYLITNTGAWLQNPEYPKTLTGWIQALTVGIPGYPPTWTFFRNTLLSSGLFTGLFVSAMNLSEAAEAKEEEAEAKEPVAEEPAPEESKA